MWCQVRFSCTSTSAAIKKKKVFPTPLSSASWQQVLQVAPQRAVWVHPLLPLHHLWVEKAKPKLETKKNIISTLTNYYVSVRVGLQLYCTCFSLVSDFIGTASCWLVIRAPCCHLLTVPLPVWLASCSVLQEETDNRITNILCMKKPGLLI